MILHFASLEVLRLALTSGAVPEAVRLAPARFAFAADQALWLEPTGVLNAGAQKELRRLGVEIAPASPQVLDRHVRHWLEVFPLERDPRGVEVSDKTPVLFELARSELLAEVAAEILRLGNDRQSFRWLESDGEVKALLRVVGPPYYSLLRSLDRNGEDAPIAYREAAPRVWIQIGYVHPLAEQLLPPAGQWLLLRAPRTWTQVPEASLRDIYEVIDFQLPDAPSAYADAALPERMRVPVRLTRSGVNDNAELWLLGEAGIAQLEDFVRSSDNELLARLAFAVGAKDGKRIVAVRVRPSKNAPPVLVLDGIAFRSYLRIPNLFVPICMALHPPLRRDAVIRLLAEDKARVTWLHPHADATFTPESLADDAFRPLSEWVDYVLEHEQQAMAAWLGATQFQFESFICTDDVEKKKETPKQPPAPKEPKKTSAKDSAAREERPAADSKKTRKSDAFTQKDAKVEPGEWEKRQRELEAAYVALDVPLEDAARQVLWRELAEVNAALNQPGDAAVCWSNALWELPNAPADWLPLRSAKEVGTRAIVRIISNDNATHGNARLVAAHLSAGPADELRSHVGKLQQFLEAHEAMLGVRLLWLAWHALYRLSGDVLARARDRVLERLYLHGLTPDLDLPGFLRFTGLQVNNRFRVVRDQVVRLHQLVQDWAARGSMATTETHAYIDLIFAYGLARLGESTEARTRLADAHKVLASADEVHSWLCAAFTHRVQQALDGKPALGLLPERLRAELAAMDRGDTPDEVKRGRDLRLKIDRLRDKSRILEPHERVGAFERWGSANANELARAIARLTDVSDRGELLDRVQALLKAKGKFKGVANAEYLIVQAALKFAPRLGQEFGEQMLERAAALYAKLKDPRQFAELLDLSLFAAGHFDHKPEVERCTQRLETFLTTEKALPYNELVPVVASGFRNLRKLGLRETAARLMQQLGDVLSAEMAGAAATGIVNEKRGKLHCLLLELASGWFYFGDEIKARKILDEARSLLVSKELYMTNQAELARAYLTALGQAPPAFALGRIMEFFRKVEGVYDVWITQSHFSLTRFMVVEAMMLALVSDDFALDPAARKRLDDDEYLVRRRIHRDVRDALAQAGM